MDMTAAAACQSSFQEALVERARALAPTLRDRAAGATAERRIPRSTIADFKEAGFFLMVRPRRFGGYEVDYDIFSQVIYELAKGCGSSAWVCSVLAEHSWLIGSFPLKVQEEIWSSGGNGLASSALAPRPIQRVEGGFLLDGDWPFSSGCDHADWALLGGLAPNDAGRMTAYSLAVPLSDIEIVDDWHVLGLRATGSKTLRLKSVFVPAYRALGDEAVTGEGHGRTLYPDSYLFRTPRGLLATYTFTPIIMALAERMLDSATDLLCKRVSRGMKAADDPSVQVKLAGAASEIEFASSTLHRRCAALVKELKASQRFTPLEIAANWRDVASLVRRTRQAAETLIEATGSQWIYEHNPMHGLLRDIWTASTHRIADWEAAMKAYGALALHPVDRS